MWNYWWCWIILKRFGLFLEQLGRQIQSEMLSNPLWSASFFFSLESKETKDQAWVAESDGDIFFPISREKWTDFVVIDVVENSALKSSSAFLKKSSRAPKQHRSCSGRRVWRHLWTLGRLKGGDCFWGTDRARYGQFLWHLGNMGKHLTIFEWLWYVRTVLG